MTHESCAFSYYGNGELKEHEMITYVQHHALLWEYYRQGKEIMPPDIKPILDNLYQGSNFNTLAKGCASHCPGLCIIMIASYVGFTQPRDYNFAALCTVSQEMSH